MEAIGCTFVLLCLPCVYKKGGGINSLLCCTKPVFGDGSRCNNKRGKKNIIFRGGKVAEHTRLRFSSDLPLFFWVILYFVLTLANRVHLVHPIIPSIQ